MAHNEYIINPETNRLLSIHGKLGKKIIKKYLNMIKKKGGSLKNSIKDYQMLFINENINNKKINRLTNNEINILDDIIYNRDIQKENISHIDYIINPETNRNVNIHGNIGKKILKKYLSVIQKGGITEEEIAVKNLNLLIEKFIEILKKLGNDFQEIIINTTNQYNTFIQDQHERNIKRVQELCISVMGDKTELQKYKSIIKRETKFPIKNAESKEFNNYDKKIGNTKFSFELQPEQAEQHSTTKIIDIDILNCTHYFDLIEWKFNEWYTDILNENNERLARYNMELKTIEGDTDTIKKYQNEPKLLENILNAEKTSLDGSTSDKITNIAKSFVKYALKYIEKRTNIENPDNGDLEAFCCMQILTEGFIFHNKYEKLDKGLQEKPKNKYPYNNFVKLYATIHTVVDSEKILKNYIKQSGGPVYPDPTNSSDKKEDKVIKIIFKNLYLLRQECFKFESQEGGAQRKRRRKKKRSKKRRSHRGSPQGSLQERWSSVKENWKYQKILDVIGDLADKQPDGEVEMYVNKPNDKLILKRRKVLKIFNTLESKMKLNIDKLDLIKTGIINFLNEIKDSAIDNFTNFLNRKNSHYIGLLEDHIEWMGLKTKLIKDSYKQINSGEFEITTVPEEKCEDCEKVPYDKRLFRDMAKTGGDDVKRCHHCLVQLMDYSKIIKLYNKEIEYRINKRKKLLEKITANNNQLRVIINKITTQKDEIKVIKVQNVIDPVEKARQEETIKKLEAQSKEINDREIEQNLIDIENIKVAIADAEEFEDVDQDAIKKLKDREEELDDKKEELEETKEEIKKNAKEKFYKIMKERLINKHKKIEKFSTEVEHFKDNYNKIKKHIDRFRSRKVIITKGSAQIDEYILDLDMALLKKLGISQKEDDILEEINISTVLEEKTKNNAEIDELYKLFHNDIDCKCGSLKNHENLQEKIKKNTQDAVTALAKRNTQEGGIYDYKPDIFTDINNYNTSAVTDKKIDFLKDLENPIILNVQFDSWKTIVEQDMKVKQQEAFGNILTQFDRLTHKLEDELHPQVSNILKTIAEDFFKKANNIYLEKTKAFSNEFIQQIENSTENLTPFIDNISERINIEKKLDKLIIERKKLAKILIVDLEIINIDKLKDYLTCEECKKIQQSEGGGEGGEGGDSEGGEGGEEEEDEEEEDEEGDDEEGDDEEYEDDDEEYEDDINFCDAHSCMDYTNRINDLIQNISNNFREIDRIDANITQKNLEQWTNNETEFKAKKETINASSSIIDKNNLNNLEAQTLKFRLKEAQLFKLWLKYKNITFSEEQGDDMITDDSSSSENKTKARNLVGEKIENRFCVHRLPCYKIDGIEKYNPVEPPKSSEQEWNEWFDKKNIPTTGYTCLMKDMIINDFYLYAMQKLFPTLIKNDANNWETFKHHKNDGIESESLKDSQSIGLYLQIISYNLYGIGDTENFIKLDGLEGDKLQAKIQFYYDTMINRLNIKVIEKYDNQGYIKPDHLKDLTSRISFEYFKKYFDFVLENLSKFAVPELFFIWCIQESSDIFFKRNLLKYYQRNIDSWEEDINLFGGKRNSVQIGGSIEELTKTFLDRADFELKLDYYEYIKDRNRAPYNSSIKNQREINWKDYWSCDFKFYLKKDIPEEIKDKIFANENLEYCPCNDEQHNNRKKLSDELEYIWICQNHQGKKVSGNSDPGFWMMGPPNDNYKLFKKYQKEKNTDLNGYITRDLRLGGFSTLTFDSLVSKDIQTKQMKCPWNNKSLYNPFKKIFHRHTFLFTDTDYIYKPFIQNDNNYIHVVHDNDMLKKEHISLLQKLEEILNPRDADERLCELEKDAMSGTWVCSPKKPKPRKLKKIITNIEFYENSHPKILKDFHLTFPLNYSRIIIRIIDFLKNEGREGERPNKDRKMYYGLDERNYNMIPPQNSVGIVKHFLTTVIIRRFKFMYRIFNSGDYAGDNDAIEVIKEIEEKENELQSALNFITDRKYTNTTWPDKNHPKSRHEVKIKDKYDLKLLTTDVADNNERYSYVDTDTTIEQEEQTEIQRNLDILRKYFKKKTVGLSGELTVKNLILENGKKYKNYIDELIILLKEEEARISGGEVKTYLTNTNIQINVLESNTFEHNKSEDTTKREMIEQLYRNIRKIPPLNNAIKRIGYVRIISPSIFYNSKKIKIKKGIIPFFTVGDTVEKKIENLNNNNKICSIEFYAPVDLNFEFKGSLKKSIIDLYDEFKIKIKPILEVQEKLSEKINIMRKIAAEALTRMDQYRWWGIMGCTNFLLGWPDYVWRGGGAQKVDNNGFEFTGFNEQISAFLSAKKNEKKYELFSKMNFIVRASDNSLTTKDDRRADEIFRQQLAYTNYHNYVYACYNFVKEEEFILTQKYKVFLKKIFNNIINDVEVLEKLVNYINKGENSCVKCEKKSDNRLEALKRRRRSDASHTCKASNISVILDETAFNTFGLIKPITHLKLSKDQIISEVKYREITDTIDPYKLNTWKFGNDIGPKLKLIQLQGSIPFINIFRRTLEGSLESILDNEEFKENYDNFQKYVVL